VLDVGSLYSQVDVYSEMLRNAPAFPLSGLACFLSGDLASQDLGFEKYREAACSTRCTVYSEML
jgi:hypothetical protein